MIVLFRRCSLLLAGVHPTVVLISQSLPPNRPGLGEEGLPKENCSRGLKGPYKRHYKHLPAMRWNDEPTFSSSVSSTHHFTSWWSLSLFLLFPTWGCVVGKVTWWRYAYGKVDYCQMNLFQKLIEAPATFGGSSAAGGES